MRFKEYIKKGEVRTATSDKSLAESLLKTAKNDLDFLKKLKIDEKSSRKIMSNYYDVLRSILEAISSIKGFKIYSHKAFTYFLKEQIKENLLSKKFERFRKIRNAINYYGKDISVEETKKNIKEINKMNNPALKGEVSNIKTKC